MTTLRSSPPHTSASGKVAARPPNLGDFKFPSPRTPSRTRTPITTAAMFARTRVRLPPSFRPPRQPTRHITAAPKPNSGPLMERRGDRALPPLTNPSRWLRTIPLFALIMAASTAAIFNYQKQSSSVVSSTLYALRTNPLARDVLGEEIYFASSVPWISGEINQLHGRIDVGFWVKGSRGRGRMRFKSRREGRMGVFSTEVWCLEMEDGTVVSLLEDEGRDPLRRDTADQVAVPA